jgi:hypothetical protein
MGRSTNVVGFVIGLALALGPITLLLVGTALMSSGVAGPPGPTWMMAATGPLWASAALIPIGLLVLGLSLPVDGWSRVLAVAACVVLGSPLLLATWFLSLIAFSTAGGEPF